MPFTAIPSTIQGVIQFQNSQTNQIAENVLHFRRQDAGTPTTSDVDAVAAWLTNNLWPLMQPAMGATWALLQATAKDISVANGYAFTSVNNSGQAGTESGDAVPGNSALAVSWRTNRTGRRNRGRSYLLGFTENVVANDRIQGALLTLIITIASFIISSNVNGTLDFAVRSIADAASKKVTAAVIETFLDSQRRRLAKRGS